MKKILIILSLVLPFASSLYAEEESSNTLTIYAYPPRHAINWKSPSKALFSFLGIELGKKLRPGKEIESINSYGESSVISSQYRSTMGHTIAQVECTTTSGERYTKWSSFSGQDFTAIDKVNLLDEKLGLGILFYDYIDGHIISGEENINRLIYYKGERKEGARVKPRYMKFDISPESCDELKSMTSFYETFHYPKGSTYEELLARDPSKVLYFTTNLDPYESFQERLSNVDAKVGGGCAPYAVGLLKAANLFDSSLDSVFKLELDVSEKLMGSKENPVTVLSLLLGKKGAHWTYDGYKNRHMSQYDPQKIWSFIGDVQECIKNRPCELDHNKWYEDNKASLSRGAKVTLTNQVQEKSVELEGIVLKKN
jgi:hypothetical protein